ncbi:hypothetical protein AHF37_05745 [Paragonimus kellicotti]|nr:hypothetical protein AHF37_05745 [Paragonimus kellicotti]
MFVPREFVQLVHKCECVRDVPSRKFPSKKEILSVSRCGESVE